MFVCECNSKECNLKLDENDYRKAKEIILEKFKDSPEIYIISIDCEGEPYDNFGRELFRNKSFILQGEIL